MSDQTLFHELIYGQKRMIRTQQPRFLCVLPDGYENAERAYFTDHETNRQTMVLATPLQPPLFVDMETGAQWCLVLQ